MKWRKKTDPDAVDVDALIAERDRYKAGWEKERRRKGRNTELVMAARKAAYSQDLTMAERDGALAKLREILDA